MVSIVDGEGGAVTGVEVRVSVSFLYLLLSTFGMNRSTSSSTYAHSCIKSDLVYPAAGGRRGKQKYVLSSNDDIPCLFG